MSRDITTGSPPAFAPAPETRLDSPALIANGNHARADAYISLAVVATAAVILKITWDSWRTVRRHGH